MRCFGASAQRRSWATLVGVLAAVLLLGPATASAARPLTRAFVDDVWFSGSAKQNASWVAKTATTGAKMVQIEVDWSGLEPAPPPRGGNASDPANGNFAFSGLDGRVRDFVGSGLTPVFLVTDAPRWAEARGGPAGAEAAGIWRPNAKAYGQFAAALARRYSGSYPDPLNPGHKLPRVRYFQAWAEPNLSAHLAPQWTRRHGRWVATGPRVYRSLLNAFYAGVKRVRRNDTVITGGLAPYGDSTGGQRMRPAVFLRSLLCLRGHFSLTPVRCPSPTRFDVLASDPYEVGSPTTHALDPDDASAPDLGRLTRIVRRAVSVGHALPRRHKRLWVTEFSYDSKPPNPEGVSVATQARWLEQSFYVFWHEGVSTVFWYLVRDQAGHNYNTSYFSGVYFHNGRRKPSFRAYRFPLVVTATSRSSSTVWGIAPNGGTVVVQRRVRGRWRTLLHVHARPGAVFVRKIPASVRGSFRARDRGETSLTWTLR